MFEQNIKEKEKEKSNGNFNEKNKKEITKYQGYYGHNINIKPNYM